MKILSAVIVVLILYTVAINAEEKKLNKEYGKELFPLSDTKQYVYESSLGETIIKASLKNGIIETKSEADNFKYQQKLLMTSEGLFINETYQRIKLLLIIKKENRVTYNRPLLRYSFPMYVGKEWKDEAIEYIDGDSNKVVVKGKVIAEEEVSTKAGTFKTIKIVTIVESEIGSKNTITEWIAEDTGLVKAIIEIQGGGIMGWVRDILGYGKITFDLKEIRN